MEDELNESQIENALSFYNENKDKIEIIGVAVGSKEEDVKKIIKQFNISYPVCMSDGKVENLYGGINAVPTTFIIDENGYIKTKRIGAMSKTELEKIMK